MAHFLAKLSPRDEAKRGYVRSQFFLFETSAGHIEVELNYKSIRRSVAVVVQTNIGLQPEPLLEINADEAPAMADGKDVESDTESLQVCPSELESEHLEDRENLVYVYTTEDWVTELVIPSPSLIKLWHRNAIRSEPGTIAAITAELEAYEIERSDGYKIFCGFCDSDFGSVSEFVLHLKRKKHRKHEHSPRSSFNRYFSRHPEKEPAKRKNPLASACAPFSCGGQSHPTIA